MKTHSLVHHHSILTTQGDRGLLQVSHLLSTIIPPPPFPWVSRTDWWCARLCVFCLSSHFPHLSDESSPFMWWLSSWQVLPAQVSEVKVVQTPVSAQGGLYHRKATAGDRSVKHTIWPCWILFTVSTSFRNSKEARDLNCKVYLQYVIVQKACRVSIWKEENILWKFCT